MGPDSERGLSFQKLPQTQPHHIPIIIHQVEIIANINWAPIIQLLAAFYSFPIITVRLQIDT